MRRKWQAVGLGVVLALTGTVAWLWAADDPPHLARRAAADKALAAGNFKDALEDYRRLVADPDNDPGKVGSDLHHAVDCLNRLGRVEEADDLRELAAALHPKNWRLLQAAADSYNRTEHYGYIVAGKFYRGHKRGGTGRYVNAMPRDRVRALQLMQQALPMAGADADKRSAAQFHLDFASMLLNSGGYAPWRLQTLTDLAKLPDYEDGYYYRGATEGAPVDADGNPVYHLLPKDYAAASTDGERWRWMLARAVELDSSLRNQVDLQFANFLRSQFEVQTMANFGRWGGNWGRPAEDADGKSGTFAVHTLGEDETIARLATGVKRFKVPDEFNWIKLYRAIATRGKSPEGSTSRETLAQIFEDRRQYEKAAVEWRTVIAEYGKNDSRAARLEQIVGNWARFEPQGVVPAGKDVTVELRFRNGEKASFEAYPVDVNKLLEDAKAYLAANPAPNLDWKKVNLQDIGYRLVKENEKQYLREREATWDVTLKPLAGHVDDRVTVKTPLTKPGLYLVTARMKDGNLSRTLVQVVDTVITRKNLDGKVLYYVADGVTGQPVAKADVVFFGYTTVNINPNKKEWKVVTTAFTEQTDADGQLILDGGKQSSDYQWLIAARKAGDGLEKTDRLAYLGFTGVYYGRTYDPEYNATKVFTVTDRPVYRPGQMVNYKFWVRHAKYDEPDVSDYANRAFTVEIHNPKGELVHSQNATADEYGGVSGEFPLPKGATLGSYGLYLKNVGGSSFRVEEYKKPEFEVTVDAPKEPVALGEKVVATVQAKYYFGAPVTSAKAKVKVTRDSASSDWYPRGGWDWFYGRGYWWFAGDYAWYPGWSEWGCKRPEPWWNWRWGRGHNPPEVVMELEAPIGPDGTIAVPIDTLPAKELHGNQDHKYTVTAEVTDESRRTIVGTGEVLVSRKPFRVFGWVDRGHYRAGDPVVASFRGQTLDGKTVAGKGELTLYKVEYKDGKAEEKAVETWKVDPDAEGNVRQQLTAKEAGQYRLSYQLTDAQKHTIEGGYLFVVRGEGFDGRSFRFNDLEITTDKREYAAGEKVRLLVTANRADSTVLLFVRPTNGVYLAPRVIRLKGKTAEEEIAVVARDMPNFFVEAMTVADGRVYTETREVVVPPEKRVLNVEAVPSKVEYLPGEKATLKVRLTDLQGKPFVGSTVVSVYDRSVEYISGGSNVPEIKEYFWKWRRHHYPQTEANVGRWYYNVLKNGEVPMGNLGVFGENIVEELTDRVKNNQEQRKEADGANRLRDAKGDAGAQAAPGAAAEFGDIGARLGAAAGEAKEAGAPGRDPGASAPTATPAVRKNFADTAFWAAALKTDENGYAEVKFDMPENLTGWKIRVWGMGHGTKVGQAETEIFTKKNLIVRLQAPRFFVEKDEVVLSANVHNYLKDAKDVTVTLETEGGTLTTLPGVNSVVKVNVPAGGEKRVDWRVKVTGEGTATVRMKAACDVESDAMQMSFPCRVHGMLKTESFSGVVRPEKDSARVEFTVPAERREAESRLEVRYSPTLAGAMVDALPYMVEYPYGCTEQTLNRFVPTVVTQNVLKRMKLNLKDIEKKRTNLNAQEIGDPAERAKQWKRFPRNPVFNEADVKEISEAGVRRLAEQQCSDGGWGWFSGWGEHSYPHTTAVVVHGLQLARENGVQLPDGMLERGVQWLTAYQAGEVQKIKNAPGKVEPFKQAADNVDALVHMVLLDAKVLNNEMREFLYRDRVKLAVYAKALFGLALAAEGQHPQELAMVLKNIGQFVEQDEENQTAWLRLPESDSWYWYGSEIEAMAFYLKLLAKTQPEDPVASRLVKYLLNNRKHSTYWNSTRDTAYCIEAMAEYMKASGEDKPDMTVEVWLDGKKRKEVKIDSSNLFSFDNVLLLTGKEVETGKHVVEVKRKGTGPVYFNAYQTNFTLEDFITRAGLEIKVNRKYYKLTAVDKKVKVPGARGQAADQKVEKYERTELANLAELKSGDLVEIELEIDSKNDYEYILFEDPKAAGFEPVQLRSGYGNELGAYMEMRDEAVCLFVRALARGKHSIAYRMRAEIPGQFSALPTKAEAMYAPELRGNSDEIKVRIVD